MTTIRLPKDGVYLRVCGVTGLGGPPAWTEGVYLRVCGVT